MSEIPALEITCQKCGGAGGYNDVEEDGGRYVCRDCGGSGFIPTVIGKRILDLIGHNAKLTISADFRVSSAQ